MAMEKEFRITCPCCDTILIVSRAEGKILETRAPIIEKSTGDRLQDAFLKAEKDRRAREAAFDNIKETLDRKKKSADDLFRASLEEARGDEGEKPPSIFDAD
ncbi:MAG: hypothetical protein ACNS63_02425 [Candidatus Nitrospinota bacterium M3_3B_026]